MFQPGNEDGYQDVLEGVRRKTLTYGDRTLMVEFQIAQGADLPRHSHPHEQTGYLVSGELKLGVGEESFVAKPGDSWTIAGDQMHDAKALADAVVIEVFTPVREDYLPKG